MGSAVTYHLAARNQHVLALEQFNIVHDFGSSHGVNRIIRLAYAEDPLYIPLLKRAYVLWDELGKKTDDRLIFLTGGIDAGREDSWIVRGSLKSCEEHKLPFQKLTAQGLQRWFPAFHLPKSMVAIYQPQGGFVLAERSIVAHVCAALDLGAEIHAREKVLGWDVQRGIVRVKTNRDTYRSRRLVLTAGPWATKLITELKGKIRPERQVLMWVQPKRPELFKMGKFPVFYMQDREAKFYGFPIYGAPGFKLGKYNHLREMVDPDHMDRECHPRDEEVLRKAIRKYFPDADGAVLSMKTCLFSNTTDGDFILDLHPDFPEVSIAAGFSGQGYKFCPVVGEVMADFALHGGSKEFDLSPFRLNRSVIRKRNR